MGLSSARIVMGWLATKLRKITRKDWCKLAKYHEFEQSMYYPYSKLCARCGNYEETHALAVRLTPLWKASLERIIGWIVNQIVLPHPLIKHFIYHTLARWMLHRFPERRGRIWWLWWTLGYAGFYQVMWNEPELCRSVEATRCPAK